MSPGVQEALDQLVGVAREGLMALSVGVGLAVMAELMEEEVTGWSAARVATATRTAR